MDLAAIFGEDNYKMLSATQINMADGELSTKNGETYDVSNDMRVLACAMPSGPIEYPTALWNAANVSNYGGAITPSTVAIHTVQGSYAGCISWFKNASASVSAQYVIRSSDGQVTQMVCHRTKAYHVGINNSLAVGIEHEGYVDQGTTWYTTAMYNSSANVVRFIAGDLGITKQRTYSGTATTGTLLLSENCYKIKGHQHYPSQTHTDPGVYWNWANFYKLVNDTPTATASTAASGTFYDSGGAAANYGNDERKTWRITTGVAAPVTLTFSNWGVEANYDFLSVYNGTSDTAPLIGKYSGTSPGTITASSGNVFMEFRSDCATTGTGWQVNWASSGCTAPTGLTVTNLRPLLARLQWTAVTGATSYTVEYKQTTATTWTTATTNANFFQLTGLKAATAYDWRVKSNCAATYATGSFTTTAIGTTTTPGSYSVSGCSGSFHDSGSNTNNYGASENWVYTINVPTGNKVQITFASFSMGNTGDKLSVYNGTSTAAPLIGTYTSTTSPGTITSSGTALTFKFVSDASTVSWGWSSSWACVPAFVGDNENSRLTTQSNGMAIYPVPTNGAKLVYLQTPNDEGTATYRLTDMQGKLLQTETLEINRSTDAPITLPSLPNGIYFVQVQLAARIETLKLIVAE